MDPGIGHEIETDLQAYGYPILWVQYLPLDLELLDWLFGADIRDGLVTSPFDIRDVWPSSYSGNTNEILWGAKVGARLPWVTCVIRLTSYECGMDQPTFTPVQQIVEHSGTLFFSFQDLDATKPAGSVKIRIETIAYYLERASASIIASKRRRWRTRFHSCRPGRDKGESCLESSNHHRSGHRQRLAAACSLPSWQAGSRASTSTAVGVRASWFKPSCSPSGR